MGLHCYSYLWGDGDLDCTTASELCVTLEFALGASSVTWLLADSGVEDTEWPLAFRKVEETFLSWNGDFCFRNLLPMEH